jgi:hypothetical protein
MSICAGPVVLHLTSRFTQPIAREERQIEIQRPLLRLFYPPATARARPIRSRFSATAVVHRLVHSVTGSIPTLPTRLWIKVVDNSSNFPSEDGVHRSHPRANRNTGQPKALKRQRSSPVGRLSSACRGLKFEVTSPEGGNLWTIDVACGNFSRPERRFLPMDRLRVTKHVPSRSRPQPER